MSLAPTFVTWVPLAAIVAIMIGTRQQPWDAMRWAGLLLALTGFVLLTVARITLGNSFSVTAQARQLVTTGIYSKIRNPVYVFSAMGLSGLVLYLHVPKFLLLLVPLAILQVVRARAEEKVLRAAFGEAYEEYRSRTWF
jgi:protein-S-isoprenylcysteine O-methyltransferase Ste14